MMVRGGLIRIVCLLGAGLLAACNLPVPTPSCTNLDLVQPIPSGPVGDTIANDLLTPILWSYPAEYECQPDGFRLEIAEDQNFATVKVTDETEAFTTSWEPSAPFAPVSEYWWRVAGGVDGAGGLELGPWSETRRFFTGPVCDQAHQTNPNLSWPTNGGTVDMLLPLLDWSYPDPDCTPESYRIDLSTEPAFADTRLSGGTGNLHTQWLPGEELLDCTTYYWRVAPMVDAALGPYSATFSFQTDASGTCIPGTSISGLVWHDMCGLPELGPYPAYPPPGCADVGGGMWGANGSLDSGEPGLEGVVIHLGAGTCPSTGLETDTTDIDGNYSFTGLTPGTYCISTDALADGNDLVLIPGGWSYPTTGSSLTSHEITIISSGESVEASFGWDFQFLPQYAGGMISGLVWHDLCAVPFGPLPTEPPEGCMTVSGGLEANGVYETGEPGIEGVAVNLGAGSCPSTGFWTTVTAADGTYFIEGLVDGTYCVTVDALVDGNDAVLIPGGWTFPARGINPSSYEVTVIAPNEEGNINFGWDYQFLPMSP
jgi:hypothetical protein